MSTLADELNLPAPPETQEAMVTQNSDDQEASVDIDIDTLDSIPEGPEALPKGTYHFRMEKFEKKTNENGPNYNVQWTCQQEPDTGRKCFDTIPYVSKQDVEDAKNTSSPNNQKARNSLKNRLWKMQQLRKACNYNVASFNPETFFATNPEVRIELNVEMKMEKDKDGKYTIPTTTPQNKVKKYLPLV